MKKTITLLVLVCILFYTSCEESDHLPRAKKYSAEVAIAWINLQQKLIKKTPGFSPGVSGRSFAYSGLALYESIVPGMPGYRSVLGHMGLRLWQSPRIVNFSTGRLVPIQLWHTL